MTFNDIKAWIKRNHRLIEGFASFEAFLHFAIGQVCGTHAREHFKEADMSLNGGAKGSVGTKAAAI